MTEVPTTEWSAGFEEGRALEAAPRFGAGRSAQDIIWRRIPGLVRHVFTHFPLELAVYVAKLPARTHAPAGTRWVAPEDVAGEALPSLMRKVLAHGRVAD